MHTPLKRGFPISYMENQVRAAAPFAKTAVHRSLSHSAADEGNLECNPAGKTRTIASQTFPDSLAVFLKRFPFMLDCAFTRIPADPPSGKRLRVVFC